MTIARMLNLLCHSDQRHGHFYINGQQFDTKLVDLPTILESQKTIDQKQLYKIADISQVRVGKSSTTNLTHIHQYLTTDASGGAPFAG